jgi:uncharacterized protein (TIGR03067 family)
VGSKRLLALVLGFAVFALFAFGVWYFAIRTTHDAGRFQGQWQMAVPATDRDGMPAVRAIPGVTIRVSGDRWVYMVGDKQMQGYMMTLRPEANPKEIDLVQLDRNEQPTQFVLRGIYAVDGDQAKVVTSIGDEPRPTSLDAPDGATVWLLERVR